ncbi:type II toxin-antitoxin system RelE/ParE family toxin [Enterobacter hormaechei subsp. hoffmannii]|uniref:type II toxin-antitoxin system RelE/ParE family toxin n=1 Tax=Enterobacter hormaechei TaxID=158836 RepID=UPI000F81E73B|nr:type II toxin-antitoxin system RelE/ParE family toxin [Enterobacter hormaechei]MCU2425261.1 type II toxin-antitoxin system RelE/ParE family toxin [Enterobacter hormaechei subsp. hoffmannii]ELC7229007.1 type II toxin-antitoxin system RelE/ParE family toxin [Enterobacter hormaechei]MBJ6501229.1 type II toxin-antitoxin system RelE/ParE family toxin [Enterobacter hormaechei]MCU2951248.1 type II toxin-antitoxin system RelE/ParE family toxin [Enterobacter hormaechei subsp. hoffmannii]MCU3337259.1
MWAIKTTDRFDNGFTSLNDSERASVLAALLVLREKGPGLSRSYADTLKGSRHSNMKELRIQSKGDPLRAFFAFDPNRTGIVLCAGNKVGNERLFYDEMLLVADREYTRWLNTLKERN